MPKYVIKAPRYINGQLIQASPDHPATIELPKGTKVDKDLLPVGSAEANAKPKPPYAQRQGPKVPTAQEVQSTPLDEQDDEDDRPSDSDSI